MSKTAATAAISTKCDFANGAGWTVQLFVKFLCYKLLHCLVVSKKQDIIFIRDILHIGDQGIIQDIIYFH